MDTATREELHWKALTQPAVTVPSDVLLSLLVALEQAGEDLGRTIAAHRCTDCGASLEYKFNGGSPGWFVVESGTVREDALEDAARYMDEEAAASEDVAASIDTSERISNKNHWLSLAKHEREHASEIRNLKDPTHA